MSNLSIPEDCSKQWQVVLLLLSTEEKAVNRTQQTEVETMKYFCSNKGINAIFLQWLTQMQSSYAEKCKEGDMAKKSDEISVYWREKGNERFRNSAIRESHKNYTKSVLYADPDGPMYPLALANRSASLIHMSKYEDCLIDIERAFDHGYPKGRHHKLFLRQATCYIKLKNTAKAKPALEKAKELALSLISQPKVFADFSRQIRELEKKLATLKEDDKPENAKVPQCCLKDENLDFVNAAMPLELRRSEDVGRHVVATEAAHRGDVLFDEAAYAFVALPLDGNLPIVCEACCRGHINPIPCKQCSRSIYCSETCRDEAWKIFHQWECAGAQSDLFVTIGIAHLALRVLLVTADKGFPPLPNNQSKETAVEDVFRIYSDMDDVKIYNKGVPDFYRMFHLVTNFKKMTASDHTQYALTAVMLTIYLEHFTSFFAHLPSRLPFNLRQEDVKVFCAALMLRSLGQLVCNGHAALSLCTLPLDDGPGSKTVSEREVRHATAIYPSAAMMNHSCDPNIINTFYRNRLIIRCGRDLPAGSEVFNCYGPHKARDTFAKRAAVLSAQYNFKCNCATCLDPDRRDSLVLFRAFSCGSCKGPVVVRPGTTKGTICLQCRSKKFKLMKARRKLAAAQELLKRAQYDRLEIRCSKTKTALKIRQRYLHRHNVELRHTADALARMYVELGEYNKSVELIKQNIQSLEYQYGSFSVEVGHDLRKLAEVMLERIIRTPQHNDYREWCLETRKVLKKVGQLMELNYGSWEPLVQDLRVREAAVASVLPDPKPAGSIHQKVHYNLKI